jgi:hypothetical protein
MPGPCSWAKRATRAFASPRKAAAAAHYLRVGACPFFYHAHAATRSGKGQITRMAEAMAANDLLSPARSAAGSPQSFILAR